MILNCAQLYARYRYAPRARAVPAGHESGCIPSPWHGTSPHRSITHNANSTLGVLVGQAHTTDHHYSAGSIYLRPAMSDYRQAWRRPQANVAHSDSDSDSYGFIEFYNTMYGFQ